MFIGTVFCADCGSKLYYRTAKIGDKLIGSCSCSEYRKARRSCTTHYITEKKLEEVILFHLRLKINLAIDDERQFAKSMMDKSRQDVEKELTPTNENTFVRRIEVHNPDKARGKGRMLRIEIFYNFIGPFEMEAVNAAKILA